jgi:uncharacterized damage-inducible protein DinB
LCIEAEALALAGAFAVGLKAGRRAMSDSNAALSAEDLLAWNEVNAKIWYTLAFQHPDVLYVPCDIYKAGTIGEMLQHIVATELRYAERLAGAPVTDYAKVPFGTADEIFATHDRAGAIVRGLIADSTFDWSRMIEFATLTAGKRRASRRAVLHHLLLHAIRHYAQLATLARQHGFKSGPADYLITNSESVES